MAADVHTTHTVHVHADLTPIANALLDAADKIAPGCVLARVRGEMKDVQSWYNCTAEEALAMLDEPRVLRDRHLWAGDFARSLP